MFSIDPSPNEEQDFGNDVLPCGIYHQENQRDFVFTLLHAELSKWEKSKYEVLQLTVQVVDEDRDDPFEFRHYSWDALPGEDNRSIDYEPNQTIRLKIQRGSRFRVTISFRPNELLHDADQELRGDLTLRITDARLVDAEDGADDEALPFTGEWPLRCKGVYQSPAAIASIPSTITFPATYCMHRQIESLEIANSGLCRNLVVHNFEITGPDSQDFSISEDFSGTSIRSDESTTVPIRFSPTTGGDKFATLTIFLEDQGILVSGNDFTVSVALEGTSTPAAKIIPDRSTRTKISVAAPRGRPDLLPVEPVDISITVGNGGCAELNIAAQLDSDASIVPSRNSLPRAYSGMDAMATRKARAAHPVWQIVGSSPPPISPGDATEITVRFDSTLIAGPSVATATVTITHNDPMTRNPISYTFQAFVS